MTSPEYQREIQEQFGVDTDSARAFSFLEQTFSPRPPDSLYDWGEKLELKPGSLVLDAGSSKAIRAKELVRRFSCRVVAVDLVHDALSEGASEADQSDILFMQGDIENLPLKDESFDAVWSRDTLEALEDATEGVREMARVIRPGGRMLLYTAYVTEQMEEKERKRLFAALRATPDSYDRNVVERAIVESRLGVMESEKISPEWSEWSLETRDEGVLEQLTNAARLLRRKDHFFERWGEQLYERMLAWNRWQLYLLLGKLETRVWILEKAGA